MRFVWWNIAPFIDVNWFDLLINKQEAFEKCWAHSPLRAAAPHAALPFTRCRYCRTPPLSHASCASMSTTTTTTRDRGDRYGPIEWAQKYVENVKNFTCMLYNCLEWHKWVLTNLYHDRQLYNILIPPWHESPAVGLRISRLSGSVS